MLRASLPVGGRALTLYDEVHPEAKYGNAQIHKRFLTQLSLILPMNCRPIIITDAGFRNPWFRAVQAMGWDFVGRVGGHSLISAYDQDDWVRVEKHFETATARARYLGQIDLTRHAPLACHAYLLRKKKQGRVKKTVFGERCEMSHRKKNARRERTPWLIVTSLEGGSSMTKRIIHLYRTRMQIEEGFRDIKNSRWGFSLDEARVSSAYRYENRLLIGTLATFAVWLTGKIAELKNMQRQYQANTIKTRNVLSTFYLGIRVLNKQESVFRREHYNQARLVLRKQYME